MIDRFDRQIQLFGAEGQAKLRATTVAVIGIGGLGTHVVQQVALLGVGGIVLVDHEDLETSNKNRYIGSRFSDPVPGSRKVDIGHRTAEDIDPTIRVVRVYQSVVSREGFDAIRQAHIVFGCLDHDGVRLVLTELCAAYAIPYVDLATEVRTEGIMAYGGRVCVSSGGNGCLMCLGVLDVREAQRDLASTAAAADRRAIYGVDQAALEQAGPSVVSVNGVVASIAVTEFIALVTGLRVPNRLTTYYGHTGKVTVSADEPFPECYYCRGIWGNRGETKLERYLGLP